MKLTTDNNSFTLASADGRGKPRSANLAFTLVEVLIAMVIAAIIFTGIFSAISSGTVVLKNTRENLRATQILESKMEGLRLIAWGTATNKLFDVKCVPPKFVETFYPLGLSGVSTNQGITYYGTMTIKTNITLTPAATYSSNMCLVTVSLSWTNTRGGALVPHTRTVSSYVAKHGLQNYVYYSIAE